jgi:hypothetical protein
MHDQAVKKNRVTPHTQLDRVKKAISRDLDPAMILSAIYVCAAQEIPKLPSGRQGRRKGRK